MDIPVCDIKSSFLIPMTLPWESSSQLLGYLLQRKISIKFWGHSNYWITKCLPYLSDSVICTAHSPNWTDSLSIHCNIHMYYEYFIWSMSWCPLFVLIQMQTTIVMLFWSDVTLIMEYDTCLHNSFGGTPRGNLSLVRISLTVDLEHSVASFMCSVCVSACHS